MAYLDVAAHAHRGQFGLVVGHRHQIHAVRSRDHRSEEVVVVAPLPRPRIRVGLGVDFDNVEERSLVYE